MGIIIILKIPGPQLFSSVCGYNNNSENTRTKNVPFMGIIIIVCGIHNNSDSYLSYLEGFDGQKRGINLTVLLSFIETQKV